MKKIFAAVLIVGLTLFACTAKNRANQNDTDASLDKLKTMSWDKVVEQAQKEGTVSWFVWYFQPGFREQAAAFTSQYGINVVIPEGDLNGNLNKARAEGAKETGSIDLLAYGSDGFPVYRDLFFGPLDFLPEYAQRVTEIAGVETNGYGLAYWGNQTGFAYDPQRVTEAELPQSFDELESWMKRHPKQFAFNDLNGGGSGQFFIQSIIHNLIPGRTYTDTLEEALADWTPVWDWLKKNREYYGLTASNADSLTRLNDGEFSLVPAWEDHMLSLQNQGAIDRRFKIYIPKMGMGGGGNFTSVLKNAPHPAASLLFIHWLTSAETQTKFNKEFGAAPKNAGADDSFAAIPSEMRQYSSIPLPSVYSVELKKQFISDFLSE